MRNNIVRERSHFNNRFKKKIVNDSLLDNDRNVAGGSSVLIRRSNLDLRS